MSHPCILYELGPPTHTHKDNLDLSHLRFRKGGGYWAEKGAIEMKATTERLETLPCLSPSFLPFLPLPLH